jgi:hypothetical protein
MAHWHLGFGDATPVGWIITLAYGFGGIACIAASRRTGTRSSSSFWLTSAALLLLLGINKQLDLQSLLTDEGRRIAVAQGWFALRRAVQAAVVGAFCAAVLLAVMILTRHGSLSRGSIRAAVGGLTTIAVFVALRAALFYHINLPLQLAQFARSWAEVLEMAGILIVSAAAAVFAAERHR